MKKLVVFLGLFVLALYCFSQSTVYEVRMSQGIVVNTHVSTTTAQVNQCDSVEDNFRKCQYEKIGVALNLVRETEQCRSFFASCGQAVLDFCETVGNTQSLSSQAYYDSLFCEAHKQEVKQEKKRAEQIVNDTVVQAINTQDTLNKIRAKYFPVDFHR